MTCQALCFKIQRTHILQNLNEFGIIMPTLKMGQWRLSYMISLAEVTQHTCIKAGFTLGSIWFIHLGLSISSKNEWQALCLVWKYTEALDTLFISRSSQGSGRNDWYSKCYDRGTQDMLRKPREGSIFSACRSWRWLHSRSDIYIISPWMRKTVCQWSTECDSWVRQHHTQQCGKMERLACLSAASKKLSASVVNWVKWQGIKPER